MSTVKAETINLSSLTLTEKVSQMVMVRVDTTDVRFFELGVGGIFVDDFHSKKDYRRTIELSQETSKIKLLVATDMEGYWNPFREFYTSKTFQQVKDGQEAYDLGEEQGAILKEMGFTLNFSPIVEVRNTVWPGRSFTGSKEEVQLKIKRYIEGLRDQGIMTTAKHYPGGSMVRNPHWWKYRTKIVDEDLQYFDKAIESRVDAVMVGHPIVYGAIDSNGKQSTISPEVIGHLRESFDGLIVTDAITMMGLRWSYLLRGNQLYVDAIRAGNDIVLDSGKRSTYPIVRKRIAAVVKAVENGELSEKDIDEHVKLILKKKGYMVTN